MSAEMRKDLAMDWARVPAVGDKRWSNDGISEDSAPVDDTDPTSSWLKSAIQLTLLPGAALDGELLASASTAQNLYLCQWREQKPRTTTVCVRADQIVHPGAEYELVIQTTKTRRLSIIKVPEDSHS